MIISTKNYALSIQNMDDYIATPCLIYGDNANLIKGFANYWLKIMKKQ